MQRRRNNNLAADIRHAESGSSRVASRHRRPAMLTAAIAVLSLVAGANSALALPVCTTTINACCMITSVNTYNFTGTVTALAGGDCIQVTKPGVILNLDNFGMAGFSSTGTGIHVLAAATGTLVNGGADLTSLTPSSISNFATGIRNDAANSLIVDFVVEGNGGSGVINNGVGATFAEFRSINNHGSASVVDNASRATFVDFVADDNSTNGVAVNSPAPPAAPTSNVRLLSFEASHNTGSSGMVLRNVTGSFVEGGTASTNDIDGIDIIGGSGNSLSELTADSNAAFGILLSKTSGNVATRIEASSNVSGGLRLRSSNANRIGRIRASSNSGGPGIWLFSSSQNSINDFQVCANSTSGIYIGCSGTSLPAEVTCGALPGGNANVVTTGVSQSNGNVGLGTGVGIGIDSGNGNNRVLTTDSVNAVATNPCNGENAGDDLEDDNANCDSNQWALNVFTSVSPTSCIH